MTQLAWGYYEKSGVIKDEINLKIRLILIYFLLAITSGFAQTFSPYETRQEKEIIQDTAYKFLQTIPINSTYLTTDNLQNIYVATSEGKIIKFDKNGQQQFEYNNNRLGQVGKISVMNPLNILVYYPNLAVIVILDRTLSVIKELNLYDLDILAPKGIALANDNNIWIYDEITAVLKKLNPAGDILFESRNLNQLVQKQISPSFLQEKNNKVYLSDTQNGLFIFDAFGQLKQTIPIKNIEQFQVLSQQLLLWKKGHAHLLNQATLEDNKLPLPIHLEAVKIIHINGNLVYLASTDKIEIYQFNN